MAEKPSYGTAQPDRDHGGLVAEVDPGSPAAEGGLVPGDRILRAEGQPLRDVIDWQWLAADLVVDLVVEAADGFRRDVTLVRDLDEGFGLSFHGVVFDGVRECDNACAFCFVSQLPAGLRRALYVRDDDFRLSFLFGNFVTLTNLADEDVARILEQRLSPLYVSLHAIDPDVRRRLVCATGEDRGVELLGTLLAKGIDIHVQIVLVPGVNDDDVLEDTLGWLARHEGVLSVGVVPLGYTSHQQRFDASFSADPTASAAVIDQLARWQARMRETRGTLWVWAADEFYLASGRALPIWDDYEDFPQYENGIGLTRAFLDELAEALEDAPGRSDSPPTPVTLVTGEMFAPVLQRVAADLHRIGIEARVLPVANRLFGGNVAVAGLLAGRDIAEAVARDAGPGPYLVPEVVVNSDGVLLDDVESGTLARLSGKEILIAPTDAHGLVETLRSLAEKEG